MDPSAWTTSFDSVFVMTDDNGQLIDTHVIQLVVTDQWATPSSTSKRCCTPSFRD